MKRIIIIALSFLLLVSIVYAVDCKEGERFIATTGKCKGVCTEAQDYVNGECLSKCRDLENHFWDNEKKKCIHVCQKNPDVYICKDYKKSMVKKPSVWSKFVAFFSSKEGELKAMPEDEKIFYQCKTSDICKGGIVSLSGTVRIDRGTDIIDAKIGTELLPGDTVVVEENTKVTLMLVETGEMKINKKTKFQIPASEKSQQKTNTVTKFFGGIWTGVKKIFGNKNPETPKPTAVAGARG